LYYIIKKEINGMPCSKTQTMGRHYKPDPRRKTSAKQKMALKGGRRLLKTLRKARKIAEPLEPIYITKGRTGVQAMKKAAHKKHDAKKPRPQVYHVLRGEPFGGLSTAKVKPMEQLLSFGVDSASLLGGAVVSSFGSNKLPIKNAKIRALIPIGIGLAAMLSPFGKNRIVRAAALGSTTVGLFSLLRSLVPALPLLSGEESAETIAAAIDRLPEEEKAILGITDQSPETADGEYKEMAAEEDLSAEDDMSGADNETFEAVNGAESEEVSSEYTEMAEEEMSGVPGYISPSSI
jgi:hypothetical protein